MAGHYPLFHPCSHWTLQQDDLLTWTPPLTRTLFVEVSASADMRTNCADAEGYSDSVPEVRSITAPSALTSVVEGLEEEIAHPGPGQGPEGSGMDCVGRVPLLKSVVRLNEAWSVNADAPADAAACCAAKCGAV